MLPLPLYSSHLSVCLEGKGRGKRGTGRKELPRSLPGPCHTRLVLSPCTVPDLYCHYHHPVPSLTHIEPLALLKGPFLTCATLLHIFPDLHSNSCSPPCILLGLCHHYGPSLTNAALVAHPDTPFPTRDISTSDVPDLHGTFHITPSTSTSTVAPPHTIPEWHGNSHTQDPHTPFLTCAIPLCTFLNSHSMPCTSLQDFSQPIAPTCVLSPTLPQPSSATDLGLSTSC